MYIIKTSKGNQTFSWKRLFRELVSDHVFESAATLSYYFLFSVFPLTILINAALSAFPLSEDFSNSISNFIPPQIQTFLSAYLNEISKGNTTTMLIVGTVLTMYSLGKAVKTLKRKIRQIYFNKKSGSFFWEWVISSVFVLLFLGSFYFTLILLVAGNYIFQWLFQHVPALQNVLSFIMDLRYAAVSAYLFFVIFGVYYVFPGIRQKKREVLPGTLFALSAWILTSWIFSFYVERLANYATLYGSLGTIIMLLTWLFLINCVLLLGAHVNANFRFSKDEKNDSNNAMLH